MCSEKKESIPLLRSFDDLSDSRSINISSLRDDKESPSTHDDPITFVRGPLPMRPIFC